MSEIYCILLYWYFILQFNHYAGQKLQTLDSTLSRDHEEDRLNLPVTGTPTIDTYLTVRPQIVLFQQNYLDELDSIPTNIADTVHAAQNSRIHQSQ